ncbi:phospholipase-like protein [Tanacetum coccineum]
MNPERYKKFKRIVFGPWLDIRTHDHDNHLINYLLQHQRYVKDPSTDTPFIFDIGHHTLEFGRQEFCLVTGFHFGKVCLDHLSKGQSGFRYRVFPGVARVKGIKLNKLLYSQTDFNNLLDDDVVRVCLLLALDFVFMGFELRHVISNQVLNLINDFSAWDNFPWGQYIWEEFHKRVYNNDHTFCKGHLKKIATLGPTYLPTYTLQGFVFPLKIWLLETFPTSKSWWFKEQNVIPKSMAWSDGTPFLKCDYDRLFNVRTRLITITPSSDEMNKPWWKSSLEYFHNVSNASTSSHAPSNKKKLRFKRKVVSHVRIEVSREVHVRTDVHHYVDEGLSVQDITSSTANDSPVDNVFSDTRDFDHDSFSRFTENPDDRAALINKITDMWVDFQRRITAIEQYLKISTSSNVEKTSNVVQDCMDVDKNPSCGSDNHVKTSVESDVDNLNVDNHSMDFHHDPKVLEKQNISGKNLFDEFEQQVSSNNEFINEALEEPNVAVNNLFQEEDQQFSSKNLDVQQEALEEPNVDQQFSAKKLDAQLEMEELFTVETLYSMIDFDIPKEAIHDHLDTLSMKNADSVQWSNDAKVDVNPTVVVNSLRIPLERDHKVSRYLQDPYMIQPDSTQPNHKVRARHKKNKKRRMPLTTPDGKLIPAWTEVYWGSAKKGVVGCLIRPAEAYWAIAGPFFNAFMLLYDLSYCYADGVTYGVPCFAQSVEKRKYIGYLQNSIFDQSLLCNSNSKATVKDQGDAYGDCGIWVMRNMYKLVNNLSLDVSNPTQLGLAYRERLTDFFWKYKIPAKQ